MMKSYGLDASALVRFIEDELGAATNNGAMRAANKVQKGAIARAFLYPTTWE